MVLFDGVASLFQVLLPINLTSLVSFERFAPIPEIFELVSTSSHAFRGVSLALNAFPTSYASFQISKNAAAALPALHSL